MRVYIAGPMRGIPYFNFPLFDQARDYCQTLGWDVISPADLDREIGFKETDSPMGIFDNDQEFNLEEACSRDVEAIIQSDGIVLLPGWEDSTGTRMELGVGIFLKRMLYEYQPMVGVFTIQTKLVARILGNAYCKMGASQCSI